MNSISLNFISPLLLLLLIPALLLAVYPYFRLPKKHRRTKRRIISMVCHIIALILTVLLLAGVSLRVENVVSKNNVMILVDLSRSTEGSQDAMAEYIANTLNNTEESKVKVGIMVFGLDVEYTSHLSTNLKDVLKNYLQTSKFPDDSATDIASAMLKAKEQISNPHSGRIIVLTDGFETDGDALTVAKQLSKEGYRIDSVFFSPTRWEDEVMITDVSVPDNVGVGETFSIFVSVKSMKPGDAKLVTYDKNNKEIASLDIHYSGGEVTDTFEMFITLDVTQKEQLFDVCTLTTRLQHMDKEGDIEEDSMVENNQFISFVVLDAIKHILIVDGTGNESGVLQQVLENTFTFKVTTTTKLPETTAELTNGFDGDNKGYDQVILMNVKYSDLVATSSTFLTSLKEYVAVYGGSVLTVGGEDTMFNDADEQTLFDEFLPINTVISNDGVLAILLVLDTSSSMVANGTVVAGYNALDWAKNAAKACVEEIDNQGNHQFLVSVMTFNNAATEIIGWTPVSQKDDILDAIDTIGYRQGTNYANALSGINAQFNKSDVNIANMKHVLFLTDGVPAQGLGSNVADRPQLVENYSKLRTVSNITLSTIGLGADIFGNAAATQLLKDMADACGGRTATVANGSQLSTIMVEETQMAMDEYKNIADVGFVPKVIDPADPSMNGLLGLPLLFGWNGCTAKSEATVVLQNGTSPLYAEWKFGEGKVGSFTSDLRGTPESWSREFIHDDAGIRFVKNIINGLISEKPINSKMTVTLDRRNFSTIIKLKVDAISKDHKMQVTVTAPDGKTSSVTLTRISRDTFSATVDTSQLGLYAFYFERKTASGDKVDSQIEYMTISYSEEFSILTSGLDNFVFVENLALAGGGKMLESEENLFSKEQITDVTVSDLQRPFLITAIILFLFDIVIRKFKFKKLDDWWKAFWEKRRLAKEAA